MDPENYTKENKNTLTNILLFLVLLALVGILFFLIKNNQKKEIVFNDTISEETPIFPQPIDVTPNPNPTPNPTPIAPPVSNPNPTPTLQNINLVVGQQYFTGFSRDTQHNYPMIYCGIESRLAPDGVNRNYMAFYTGSCEGDINDSKAQSLTDFLVGVDNENHLSKLEDLNKKYGVSIVNTIGPTMYSLKTNGDINAYTMSKIYFDSGNFTFAEPDALITGQNN